jgi:endonuclease VIII
LRSIPEGDTIRRTATTLQKWLVGREVTAAASTKVAAERLVGDEIEQIEARGKHLLIRFAGGLTLHTHMRMTGSWHVYRAGERWRQPRHLARVVLESGDRVAVCFSAPVIELLPTQAEWRHPMMAGLGPDILKATVDLDEIRHRAAGQPADRPIGDLLLDQRVVAGIGNIWRSEALFESQVHPSTPQRRVAVAQVVQVAARLMQAHARMGARYNPAVYKRTGRPCRRCGTPIKSSPIGEHARTAYWCPRCQPR